MAKIAIIVGHPQNQTLCEALAQAYERGARAAGHETKSFALSQMNFDPILRGGYRSEQPLEPDLQAAYDWCANDPYGKAGLFESVTVRPYRALLGKSKQA